MKKLFTLILAILGVVSTSNAWNDNLYLICQQNNNWSYTDPYNQNFKFVRIDDSHFRATVPGSYIHDDKWNFRFREQNGDWYNVGPMSESAADNQEVTENNPVRTNWHNSTLCSFYVSQNQNASFIQIFLAWDGVYWNVTAKVITDKYTVAYANPDGWSTVKAYAYYNVDNCPKQEPLGGWSGTAMTLNDGQVYTIDVPAINGGEIIFTDGSGHQYPANGGFDIVENGVYGNSGLVEEVSVSIGEAGYGTFSSAYPVDFTGIEGVTAYRAIQTSDNKVLLKKVTGKVPAATGLVLKGTNGTRIPTTIEGTDIGDNNMVATVKDTPIEIVNLGGAYYYFLAGTTAENIGFYSLGIGNYTSLAGKAYYYTATHALADEETSARAAWIIEGEETQGINNVENIQNSDVIYDLQGRVAKTAKAGLYIKNGKKVVMK